MDRSTVVAGPAYIEWKGGIFYSAGDVNLAGSLDTAKLSSAMYGEDTTIVQGAAVKCSFTPVLITEACLPLMWPYFSTRVGASLFGATDEPLIIHANTGKKISIIAAALTKMPDLNPQSGANMLGDMEFTGVRKNSSAYATADSLIKVESETFDDPETFNPVSRCTGLFAGAWAASGAWSAFYTESGFKITFPMRFREWKPDGQGMVDAYFQSMDVTVSCRPIPSGTTPIDEAALVTALGLQGTGTGVGKSLATMPSAYDLTISNDATTAQTPKRKLTIVVNKAHPTEGPLIFGADNNRIGDVSWTASRVFSGTSIGPLATIALS